MTASLLSIGSAVPAGVLTQARAVELARTFSPGDVPPGVIETLHHRTGIQTRGSVLVNPIDGSQTMYAPDEANKGPTTAARLAPYLQAASDLACEACEKALCRADIAPRRVTHLITASCTGFDAPGVDYAIMTRLHLSPAVARTNIGFMGCHAAINSLRVAAAIATADPAAVVLLCCVELCTLHMHYSARMDQLIANALFADGAAAAVVSSHAPVDTPRIAVTASRMFPDSARSMEWHIGDHGFEMTLGADVPERLTGAIPGWIDEVLASCELRRGDVRGWAIHPGGPKIVEVIAGALGLERSATRDSLSVLHERGNMSSATVLFILERFLSERIPRPWAAMAFGPGLAGEAAVLT